MRNSYLIKSIFGLFIVLSLQLKAQKVENIIIITTDGLRWQEVFGGLDSSILNNPKYTENAKELTSKYTADSNEESRQKLLPFLWTKIAKEGIIIGNRNLGSKANIKNKYGFSYPGYNEILTGYADDSINSNDKVYNPNVSVLEYLNNTPKFKGKVAAFTTWDVFPFIINDKRSQIPVNSGKMPQKGSLNETQTLLENIQQLVPSLASNRNDYITYFMAREYLKKENPKVLYISFDETDEYAHEGKYRNYIEAAHTFDTFVEDIWKYCESNPKYRGKTALILTTDHGRGNATKSEWTSHGQKVADCNEIWMAFLGPNIKNLGEIKTNSQVYQNQLAASIAKILGENYKTKNEIGAPLSFIFK